MRTLQLTALARVRLWLDERSTDGYPTVDALEKRAPAGRHRTEPQRSVCIEAVVPRGARCEYGLLGVEFSPDLLAEIRYEVGYSNALGTVWHNSIGGVDEVRLGLPLEYAHAVLSSLERAGDGRLASGLMRVTDAAHGLVGSSANLFSRLAAVCVDLAIGVEVPDSELVLALRKALQC